MPQPPALGILLSGMWIQHGWVPPGTGRPGATAPPVAMAAGKQLGVLIGLEIQWKFDEDLRGLEI